MTTASSQATLDPLAVHFQHGLRPRATTVLWVLAALLLPMAALSAASGGVSIPVGEVLGYVASLIGLGGAEAVEPRTALVLGSIRLPRIVLGLVVGASLGISGAVLQGLFRNPLADPGLIGVSSGAALAAVATIVLGAQLLPYLSDMARPLLLPIAAFLGGLAVTVLIYTLARKDGQVSVATMLLIGIALNAIAGSAIGLLTYLSNDMQLRELTFWSMGGLGNALWSAMLPALVMMTLATVFLVRLARPLNLFLLGEAEAYHLGIPVERLKRRAILLVALAVGAGVAVAGPIAFVGLVVAHLVRLMTGPDHRFVLPGAAVLGALLVLGADILARTIALPAEVPIGLILSTVGGPFFLALLVRQRRKGLA